MILGCVSLSLGHLVLVMSGQIVWIVLSQILIQCHNAFHMAAAAHVTNTVAFTQKSRALSIMDSIGNVARAVAATAGGFLLAATNVQTTLEIAAVFPVVTMLMVVLMVRNLQSPKVDQER